VIETTSVLPRSIDVEPAPRVRPGTHIVALGYPAPDLTFELSSGSILGFSATGVIKADLSADVGSSGSPALTSRGKLAGVVVGGMPGIVRVNTILLPASWVQRTIDDARYGGRHTAISCEEMAQVLAPQIADQLAEEGSTREVQPQDQSVVPQRAPERFDIDDPEPPADPGQDLPSHCYYTDRGHTDYACDYVWEDGSPMTCYFEANDSYCVEYGSEPAPSEDPSDEPTPDPDPATRPSDCGDTDACGSPDPTGGADEPTLENQDSRGVEEAT
jgi:hypothetical protein